MDKNTKESVFIKKYPLIFKKYRPLKKIANGAFSEIYYGINIQNNNKIAIKTEYRFTINKLLESESFLLFSLKGIGIPKVLSFGHNKEYDILIMPLLGKSLKELYISKNSNFEFKDICLMGMQIMERIKWVHSHNIIHRDIKPDNFLIGLEDPNIIYLIDFGLSKKYKSSTTGKHISFSELKKFTGTVSYASANALRFKEQSRRDDLESICYMLIYLMKGSLPWQKIKVNNKKESYLKVGQFKRNIKPEKLCENLPGEMIDFLNYVKKLKFEEDPDYNYLKNLFEIMLKKRGDDPDHIYFSWIDEKNIKKLKKPVDYTKRSSNSRERIINKIRNSLSYKRSLSDNKNNLKQNTDYNSKIKSYLDEKVLNNIKYYDLSKSKTYSDVSNKNQHINYVNNSINNNYITISVSISNANTNTNMNSKNENNNILSNSVSSLKKNIYGNNNLAMYGKSFDNNLIKNNECNQKIINIENKSTNLKKYKELSPNLILNKVNKKFIPYIEYDINTNSNTVFKNYILKDRNNYKKICIKEDKSLLYGKDRNYNFNTINNHSNNNTSIYFQKTLNNNNIKSINNYSIEDNKINNNHLKDQKKNNIIKRQTKNINLKNLKEKLFNIGIPENISNNNMQKNDSQSATYNNELMREIKNFNLRFNYGNNIKYGYGEKMSKQNKTKKLIEMKLPQNNKSEEQIKYSNLKNRINTTNCQLNNMDNNCFIF